MALYSKLTSSVRELHTQVLSDLNKAKMSIAPKKLYLTDDSRRQSMEYVLGAKRKIEKSCEQVLPVLRGFDNEEQKKFSLLSEASLQVLGDVVFFCKLKTYTDFGGREKYLSFLREHIDNLIKLILGFNEFLIQMLVKIDTFHSMMETLSIDSSDLPIIESDVSNKLEAPWSSYFEDLKSEGVLEGSNEPLLLSFFCGGFSFEVW